MLEPAYKSGHGAGLGMKEIQLGSSNRLDTGGQLLLNTNNMLLMEESKNN